MFLTELLYIQSSQDIFAKCLTVNNIFIDYEIGFKGWSINVALPVIIIISNIAMLILTIISHKQFIKYAIYQLFIVFFSSIPFILLTENIIQNKMLSVIAISISIINLIVSLVWCTKDLKEALIRKDQEIKDFQIFRDMPSKLGKRKEDLSDE